MKVEGMGIYSTINHLAALVLDMTSNIRRRQQIIVSLMAKVADRILRIGDDNLLIFS